MIFYSAIGYSLRTYLALVWFFKAKKKPNNPDRNLNNDKEKKTISNNDDPFVNIRAKKTLNTYAEKILKDK